MTSNDEGKDVVLNEMRKSYEVQLDLKQNLESKAKNIITVSGLVVTLLFGFSSFLLKSPIQVEWLNYCYLLTFISIIFSIIALACSLHSLRIREYSFVMSENNLEDIVDKLKTLRIGECLDRLIDSYMFSIKLNTLTNNRIASIITTSHLFLFLAILLIGIIAGLVAYPFILKVFNL
jgi:hypothetical protein